MPGGPGTVIPGPPSVNPQPASTPSTPAPTASNNPRRFMPGTVAVDPGAARELPGEPDRGPAVGRTKGPRACGSPTADLCCRHNTATTHRAKPIQRRRGIDPWAPRTAVPSVTFVAARATGTAVLSRGFPARPRQTADP